MTVLPTVPRLLSGNSPVFLVKPIVFFIWGWGGCSETKKCPQ